MSFYFCRNSSSLSTSAASPEGLPWKRNQFYSLARTALKVGLEAYSTQLKNGSVLVPQFTCEESLTPFKELGLQTTPYLVDKSLSPVNLEQTIQTSGASGIMIIHYFGIAQRLDLIQDLCTKYNLILIEDNAHGFGGHWNGQRLGTFGDIGIHSFRKNYPVNDGALLETKKAFSPPTLPVAPDKSGINFKEKLKAFLFSLKEFRNLFQDKRLRSFYSVGHFDAEHQMISVRAHEQIASYLAQDWSAKRRAQFFVWQQCAHKLKWTPVFHEVGSSSPLCFPVWMNSLEERDFWLKKLFVLGIDAYPWPTQAPNINYWEHLICLPINPWIETAELQSILEAM